MPSTMSWRCLQKGSSATCKDDVEVEGADSAVAAAADDDDDEEKERFVAAANAAAAPSVMLEHDTTPDVRAAAVAARSWEAARRMVLGRVMEKQEKLYEKKGD